jgi:hypothetical protein
LKSLSAIIIGSAAPARASSVNASAVAFNATWYGAYMDELLMMKAGQNMFCYATNLKAPACPPIASGISQEAPDLCLRTVPVGAEDQCPRVPRPAGTGLAIAPGCVSDRRDPGAVGTKYDV